MKRFVFAAAVGVAAFVMTTAPALAGNLSKYDGASWYDKYLSVSSGTTPVCSGNTGSGPQFAEGNNVDASHECGSQSETSIAINPKNARNVLVGSNEIQSLPMDAMASLDGGATFTQVDLPLPPPRTRNGFDFGSDPGVAFDSDGNAYYSYIVVFFSTGGSINGTEMAVAKSTDGGLTWKDSDVTYFAPQTGEGQFDDKPMITVDTRATPNRIYVAWDNATGNSSSTKNGNNVVLSHSEDSGKTFSAPVSVSGPFTGKTGGIGADPYVTSNGTLHVAWQDYAHLVIADASSTDGGNTFTAPHVIALIGGFQFNVAAQSTRGALV
ncbi:MAG: glycoside hydrolase, partial [Actinomycetota bacterium]|nr:glycoside hydrolase [Actinomycetota bacterium]